VAENVYTKVLRQAAAIEASTQALATVLRVPENTLLRWMSGRAQMPLRAFLKAIDLVAAQEVAGSAAPPAQHDERLHFNLGSTLARCGACGGTQFRRANAAQSLTYTSTLVCCACGADINHGRLVVALAHEVGQLARQRLAAMKRRSVQHRNAACTGELTSTKEAPHVRQHSGSGQHPAAAQAPHREGT
jgi:hypothetical protein